jgi:hypothetical protein
MQIPYHGGCRCRAHVILIQLFVIILDIVFEVEILAQTAGTVALGNFAPLALFASVRYRRRGIGNFGDAVGG